MNGALRFALGKLQGTINQGIKAHFIIIIFADL